MLDEIFEYIKNSSKEWDYYFLRTFVKNKYEFKKRLHSLFYELKSIDLDTKNLTILDAGAGAGIYSIIFSLLGASQVFSIDTNFPLLNSFKKIIDKFNFRRIFIINADLQKIPLQSESVDFIYCRETISHISNYIEFLKECLRILKKRGKIYICDDNNILNPFIKRRLKIIWKYFEEGPVTSNIYNHRVFRPFIIERQDIIKKHFPYLNEEEIFKLSLGTSGLTQEKIISLCSTYIRNKQFPSYFYKIGTPPRSPYTGQFIERGFNPKKLAEDLERIGFSHIKYYAHIGSRNRIIRSINNLVRKFSLISVYLSLGFRIEARK